jgi:hypothetical protein
MTPTVAKMIPHSLKLMIASSDWMRQAEEAERYAKFRRRMALIQIVGTILALISVPFIYFLVRNRAKLS